MSCLKTLRDASEKRNLSPGYRRTGWGPLKTKPTAMPVHGRGELNRERLSESKMIRLNQWELREQLHAWDVAVSEDTCDLEKRALLFETMRGQEEGALANITPASTPNSRLFSRTYLVFVLAKCHRCAMPLWFLSLFEFQRRRHARLVSI